MIATPYLSCAADRPSQMLVGVATTDSFKDAHALPPVAALPESDFTAKMLLENLPGGRDIFYRVKFRDLSHTSVESEPVVGRVRTAPADKRDVSFVWVATSLAARALRAFHKMYPIRESIVEPGRVYRALSYGPHLDVFVLDERSYRGPNGPKSERILTVRTPVSWVPTRWLG